MREWLGRTWRRLREEPPRRALRASGYEATAGTAGRLASGAYGLRASPTPIWDRDWDVCCLLDGCRLDLMREAAGAGTHGFLPEPDGVDGLWSVGSQSAEWMARTFDDRYAAERERTAYVTGNPFSAQDPTQIEAVDTDPLPLSGDDVGLLLEPWREEWIDGEISTIPPGPLTDRAMSVWRRREELDVDRVIVHYMQPHAPFRSRPDWFLGTADPTGWGSLESDDGLDDVEAVETEPTDLTRADLDQETIEFFEALEANADAVRDPWTRLRNGELDRETLWAAYRDNLEWVLDDVARLVENCDGRIALASDHGNGAGEFGVWSHPPGVHLPALRRVPWVTVDGRDERSVEPGLPPELDADGDRSDEAGDDGVEADGEEVESRLEALGYR